MSTAFVNIAARDMTAKAFASVEKRTKAAVKNLVAMSSAAALVAGSYAVVETTKYNAALSDLSAITGATGDNLAYLGSQAKKFGATTTLSASQSVTAMKLIASAKPDLLENAAALASVTGEVIKLSEASGIELAGAASAVGSALNQFGAEADQAGRFVNVLAAGAKFGASAVGDTAIALKNAGTIASGAGLSFEATNAAIQAMAKVGIMGGEAGTGLRNVLLKLSTQTRDEFNPEIVGFTQAMLNLRDAHLTTSEKSKLFGAESIGAANALMKEAGSLGALTTKLTGTNVALEQARTRNDNLAGDLKSLQSATEGAALALGSNLDPWLRNVTQASTEAMLGLATLINVMADADEQSALAVQIADTSDRLKDLKENGLFMSGEFLSFPTEEAAIASLTRELDSLESRRNKVLSQGASVPDVSKPSKGGAVEIIRAEEEAKASVLAESQAAKLQTEKETAAQEVAAARERFALLAAAGIAANDDAETRAMDAYQKKVDALDAEKELLMQHGAWKLENQAAYDEAQAALAEQLENKIIDIRKRGMDANEKLAAASAKTQLSTAAGLLTSLTASASTESRAMFEINKAASLATATIKGIDAVQSSYATGAAIGGPVLGTAFAGVALAATAANLQKIKSTSFSGGGGVGSVGGGAPSIPSQATNTGAPVTPTVNNAQQAPAPSAPNQYTFHIGAGVDEAMVRDTIVPIIRDLDENGEVTVLSENGVTAQRIRDAA